MEEGDYTTSTSFRQRYKIKKWTSEGMLNHKVHTFICVSRIVASCCYFAETGKFYKALSQVGTDFTMMTLLLPSRSRKELKVIITLHIAMKINNGVGLTGACETCVQKEGLGW